MKKIIRVVRNVIVNKDLMKEYRNNQKLCVYYMQKSEEITLHFTDNEQRKSECLQKFNEIIDRQLEIREEAFKKIKVVLNVRNPNISRRL
jgi:hypothetical protein